jgi:pimeloyl-ACP methyl ester carboxylesterase
MRSYLSLMFFALVAGNATAQSVKKITLDKEDFYSGSYLVVEPEDTIKGALVLIAGFGQRPEDTFPQTKLPNVGYVNNILVVSYAAGNKLYADSITQVKLTRVVKDIMSRYHIPHDKFVIGGFSAGGMIALRYVELCNEFPTKFPIHPKAVFMVDAPIDIFTIWESLEESYRNNYSEMAYEEAERAMRHIREDYGEPRKNTAKYSDLTAFSMDKKYGEHEKFLKNTAVRAYHDVDIAWRLTNRNQAVHNSNYEVSAELINRLLLMGNKKAEFMQTFRTGYRANGTRHPHSWSIVDEAELIQWMKQQIN